MKSLFVNPEDQSILRTERNIQNHSKVFQSILYAFLHADYTIQTRTVKKKKTYGSVSLEMLLVVQFSLKIFNEQISK